MKEARKNNLPEHLFANKITFDHNQELMTVILKNGYTMVFLLHEFQSQRLKKATPQQRENWEFIAGGVGVHWEDIDEDLSVKGFIRSYIKKTKSFIAENESVVA
ncbi:MAG: DUF2442 domain-containing protein [Bacteroidetes bacterium]|nr:DUF2442 domain-containing protein [Bacteroidota bacterium]